MSSAVVPLVVRPLVLQRRLVRRAASAACLLHLLRQIQVPTRRRSQGLRAVRLGLVFHRLHRLRHSARLVLLLRNLLERQYQLRV